MNYLKILSALPAPSGSERAASKKLAELLSSYTDDITVTPLGSTVGFIRSGKPNARRIMLSTHIDSVSCFVTELCGGFLKIAVNGMDRRVMLNAEYTVLGGGGNVRALPCVLPPHLQKESGKVPKDDEMILDTGLSPENLKKKVSVGDCVIFTPRYEKLLGKRTACASADNRASCAAVFEALDLIKENKLPCDLVVAFTSCEEANASGAATAAFKYEPDEAIILDVTFAETPDTHRPEAGEMGGGTMIGVSPILSCDVVNRLIAAAKDAGQKYQLEVMPRATGTDADEIVTAGRGVPCGTLSTPLRYMHTPSEVTDGADIASTAAVLARYIMTEGEKKNV